jgi:hypothetical protein
VPSCRESGTASRCAPRSTLILTDGRGCLSGWARSGGGPCGLSPGHALQSCFAKLARDGYRQQASYQPVSRFWPLQADETAIHLIPAVVLGGICTWRIRRLS